MCIYTVTMQQYLTWQVSYLWVGLLRMLSSRAPLCSGSPQAHDSIMDVVLPFLDERKIWWIYIKDLRLKYFYVHTMTVHSLWRGNRWCPWEKMTSLTSMNRQCCVCWGAGSGERQPWWAVVMETHSFWAMESDEVRCRLRFHKKAWMRQGFFIRCWRNLKMGRFNSDINKLLLWSVEVVFIHL